MKFSGSDFALMRWSILAIFASSLVSVVILYGSGDYAEKARKERRSAQDILNDARNRLATAHQDQENMDIYASEYSLLIEDKVIGDDQRLDWMEGLEKIRRQNLVTDFRYTIAPQKIYTPQPPVDSGNFDVRYSEMKLQLDLLHEGQLPDFFNALHNQVKGWYQLEGCTLQRTAPGDGAAAATYIKAECSGGWITLKNRNAPQ
ncbi:MAG: hypothetical protein A2143_13385 [Gallionellales bacterium RBG_16_57_15]|nr:MAG: hypothetical protein A2143_13385 [Gallionellales bacterium RBG_16_57_15]